MAALRAPGLWGGPAPAPPLDLRDLLAAALGRLGQRLDLQDAARRRERRGRVAERLAVDVERVVRRAVHGRPGARGQREPAGAGVGRRLRQQAVPGRVRAVLEQVAETRRVALVRELLDRFLAHAVGREE